ARRKRGDHVRGSLDELAHPVGGPVADVLSIARVTADLEAFDFSQPREEREQAHPTSSNDFWIDVAGRVTWNIVERRSSHFHRRHIPGDIVRLDMSREHQAEWHGDNTRSR